MKIGILTLYDNRNIGNRLQNYALQQVLLQYAEDVITFRNKPGKLSFAERLRRGIPLAESVWFNRLMGEKRKARILQFNRTHLSMSKRCYWYGGNRILIHAKDVCDWYCAGSDQIWNPCLGRTDSFHYLGFAPRSRTFSYAASFGIDEIPEEQTMAIREGLRHIRFLSVRETAGKKIAEVLTGWQDVEVLPDPTLLLSQEEWNQIARMPKIQLPRQYLVTYFLGEVAPWQREAIAKTASEKNWELVELMRPDSPWQETGPEEFLYIISHAQLICTDSFHGSVFSFLYQRQLWIFDRSGEGSTMGSRLDTLTEVYALKNCRVQGDRMPQLLQSADYSAGYAVLRRERAKAAAFLDRIFRPEETE